MAEKYSGANYKILWRLVSPSGPALSNHVGCLIGNCMYIHGGIDKHGSTVPLNKLFKMDLNEGIWNEVRAADSPALSHHACVVLENRYIFIVGGWDGKRRTCAAHVFDTHEQKWRSLQTTGFPEGAGLSSHSACLLANGQILLVGREGSLRMQRRSGQAYVLVGDLQTGVYEYRLNGMHADSRSGHTAHILGQTLAVIGGRDDKIIELHRGFKGAYSSGCAGNTVIQQLWAICKQLHPMTKPPGGRKQHVGMDGGAGVLIHGGETFSGRTREPVDEVYMLALKPTYQWGNLTRFDPFSLGHSGIGRAAHVMCASPDKVIIHGGFTGKTNAVMGDSYALEVSQVN